MRATNRHYLIDASGSMAEKIGAMTKLECVKRAIRDLVPALPRCDRLGIISFSDNASVILPLTPVHMFRGTLDRALVVMQPGGSTNLAAALRVGCEQLEARPACFDRRLVVLSDGQPTSASNEIDTQIARSISASVRIDAIGFGLGAQICQALLRNIAARTSGTYSYAAEVHRLRRALRCAA